MLRPPFKRLIVILVPCILLIGLMVPLATFAAAPKPQAASVSSTTASSTTVPIMNRCGPAIPNVTPYPEGPFNLATLNKGQEIDITAVNTVTEDATHEQEALSIYAVGQRFINLIFANTGSHSFEYVANKNNVDVVACYVLVRDDDEGDFTLADFFTNPLHKHTATVTYEVEPANL